MFNIYPVGAVKMVPSYRAIKYLRPPLRVRGVIAGDIRIGFEIGVRSTAIYEKLLSFTSSRMYSSILICSRAHTHIHRYSEGIVAVVQCVLKFLCYRGFFRRTRNLVYDHVVCVTTAT